MLTDAVEKVPNFFAANFLPRDETRDFCSSIYPQAGCRSHWRVHRFMMRPHTIVGSLHRRLGKFQRCKKTFSTASTRCASRPTEMRNAGSHDNLLTESATTGRREMPNQPARTLETYTRQRTGYYVHEAWKDTAAAHAAMAGRKCTRLLSRIETACLAGSACRWPRGNNPSNGTKARRDSGNRERH